MQSSSGLDINKMLQDLTKKVESITSIQNNNNSNINNMFKEIDRALIAAVGKKKAEKIIGAKKPSSKPIKKPSANQLFQATLSEKLSELFQNHINSKPDDKAKTFAEVIDYINKLGSELPNFSNSFHIKAEKLSVIKNSSILPEAAKNGSVEMIKFLIEYLTEEKAYDPLQTNDEYPNYPHSYAIKHGNVECLDFLYKTAKESKTDSIDLLNIKDTNQTCLVLAIQEKHTKEEDINKQNKMIDYLLAKHVDTKEALLFAATATINTLLVEKFIQHGASYTDGMIEILTVLIDHIEKSDPYIKEEDPFEVLRIILQKFTPSEKELNDVLMHTIQHNYFYNHSEVIPLLVKHNAKVSKVDLTVMLLEKLHKRWNQAYPKTPSTKFLKKIEGLINLGADVNFSNSYGKTSLEYALWLPSIELTEIILKTEGIKKDGFLISGLLRGVQNTTTYELLKLLVNAGTPVEKDALDTYQNTYKEQLNKKSNTDSHDILIINYIYALLKNAYMQLENLKKQIEKSKINLKDKNPANTSETELNNYNSEEKHAKNDYTAEEMFKLFNFNTPIVKITKSKDIEDLIHKSFLGEKPDQDLLKKIYKDYINDYKNNYCFRNNHLDLLSIFIHMVNQLKTFNEKNTILSNAILNLIQNLQDANLQLFFLPHPNTSGYRQEMPLSYCTDNPDLVQALLKVCPFEQRRALDKTNKEKLANNENNKGPLKADLFDLLFYIENRTNDGDNQINRKKALCEITELLHNENYLKARELIDEKSKSLRSTALAVIGIFHKIPENTVDILTGILQQYKTPEELAPHARRFITYVEIHQNKILSEVLAKSKPNSPISNLPSNSINNKK